MQNEKIRLAEAHQRIGELEERAASGNILQETANYFINQLTISKMQTEAFEAVVKQYEDLKQQYK